MCVSDLDINETYSKTNVLAVTIDVNVSHKIITGL